MATTTNYGWTTPDDTALVKDGAAAIRTLGSSVDSTLKTQIDAQIAKSIVDAKGDIIAATAADTVSRLEVGANDTVLVADSTTATGLKWAVPASGGMTLLSTTTLSGTSTTISSVPQTYVNLLIVLTGVTYSASANLAVGINGSATSAAVTCFLLGSAGKTDNRVTPLDDGIRASNSSNASQVTIFNYTSTGFKPVSFTGRTSGSPDGSVSGGGVYTTAAAATSITIGTTGGTATMGGTVLLYGVK